MSEYTIVAREQATDFMADYPGFGEMRSFTGALSAEQVAFTWRRMPPNTGGRDSYGHRHKTQEEIYYVASGVVTFKVAADVFSAASGTAVRVGPGALRSVHNDAEHAAELIICSTRVEDLRADTETEDGFWPD